jgi:hypothetical protein
MRRSRKVTLVVTAKIPAMICQLEPWRTAMNANPAVAKSMAVTRVALPPDRATSLPASGAVTTPARLPGSRYTTLAANTVEPKPYPAIDDGSGQTM